MGRKSGKARAARVGLAAAITGVVLLAGAGVASAREAEMTGTPGPGKTVTLSGAECSGFGLGPEGPTSVGEPVQITLAEKLSDGSAKVVDTQSETAQPDGNWSIDFLIPKESPVTGDPVVSGKTYKFFLSCRRPSQGEAGGTFAYDEIEFVMGQGGGPAPVPEPDPRPEPDPQPAPEPEPTPAPAPATTAPPSVLGTAASQPPPAPQAAPPLPAPQTLPRTGDATSELATVAVALLALGAVVTALSRQLRAARSA